MKDVFKLLPKFSLANTASVESMQVLVPDLLLLCKENAYPVSPEDFSKHVTINRSAEHKIFVKRLKRTSEPQVVYIKGGFHCINASLPPVETSENCSAVWLGDEVKQLQAIDYLSHSRTGLYVTVKDNTEDFWLKFPKGVSVEVDLVSVWTAKLQSNQGLDLHKLVLEKTGQLPKESSAQLKM